MQDPTGTLAPILVVPDVAQAAETYERVFGFRRLRYFDGNDEYVPLGRGHAQVHLIHGRATNPNHRGSAHAADVFVWVDELDSLVDAARAKSPYFRLLAPDFTPQPVYESMKAFTAGLENPQ